MPSFDVKIWRAKRPKSAKDEGVAAAIKACDSALKKTMSQMTEAEANTAGAAVKEMVGALDGAEKAIKGDKKDKDRSEILALIADWKSECDTLARDVKERLYRIKVERVEAQYVNEYDLIKADVDKYHAEADRHQRGGEQPDDKALQRYLIAVRDGSKTCSKQFIPTMSADAKQVKVDDVKMPVDLKATKAKIEQLKDWAIAFTKQGKRDVRAEAANLDDTQAANKAVKGVMAAYGEIEAAMKLLIKRAEGLALLGERYADDVKKQIALGNKDPDEFKELVRTIKQISGAADKATSDLEDLGEKWRTASSPIGKMVAAVRSEAGFDEKTHGALMLKRMQANQMLIRRVTLAVGGCRQQVARAKRLLNDSNDHRGYGGTI